MKIVIALTTIPLVLSALISATSLAFAEQAYPIAEAPMCMNDKGETVEFLNRENVRLPVAAGMANRNSEGEPFVMRFNYAKTPTEFQAFIDRHECAHHQTGDVDRPHPPRNGPEHMLNESISDCISIMRLRDEENYRQEGLQKIADTMRSDMSEIGFPEISISSRISNLENCYARDGNAANYIKEIIRRRSE